MLRGEGVDGSRSRRLSTALRLPCLGRIDILVGIDLDVRDDGLSEEVRSETVDEDCRRDEKCRDCELQKIFHNITENQKITVNADP